MPARPLRLAALAVLAAVACTPVERPPAPLDRFTYPTGLAVQDGHLLVVSSNYDLTYEDDRGGSVMSIDPLASLEGSMAIESALRIPSFGGEIAVARAADCAGLAGDVALVPNRLTGELFRLGLDAAGGLSCGAGCKIPLTGDEQGDPFAVEVVCRPGRTPFAYVGWLRTRIGTACSTLDPTTTCGMLSEVPLDGSAGPSEGTVLVNNGGIRELIYDPSQELLFFLGTGSRVGWVDFSSGCQIGSETTACSAQTVELGNAVRGLEVRSLAVGSDEFSPRLYVAGRVVDPDAAASGVRVEVGGVLVVLAVESAALGGHDLRVVRTVSLGAGVSEVKSIRRPGKRDVLAITATDDGELWFWDDELGAVTGVIARGSNGKPLLGSQPYGLALEDRGAGLPVRLYVGSFGDALVSVVDVDPDDPGSAVIGKRIGE